MISVVVDFHKTTNLQQIKNVFRFIDISINDAAANRTTAAANINISPPMLKNKFSYKFWINVSGSSFAMLLICKINIYIEDINLQ